MFHKNHSEKINYLPVENKRFLITSFLLAFSLSLILYCHFILEVEVVFTHFFYIPIIVVGIWWGYWAILVAVLLGAALFASYLYVGGSSLSENLLRIFFFIVVSYLVGLVSNSEKETSCKLFESGKTLETKETIISLLSHQLLGPLVAAKFSLEMLYRDKIRGITKKQKHFLMQAHSGIEKAVYLIREFLQLSKIEAGKIKYSAKFTDLSELIEKVISTHKKTIKEKQQEVHFIKDNMAKVNIDPLIFSQIIEILFSNAVKYAPCGGKIEISVETFKKDILLKISDNGCGIPEQEQKSVFKKFFRGSNVVENTPTGAGLGLSIVKSLVDFCGGNIRFESQKNKGTTFYCSLPR